MIPLAAAASRGSATVIPPTAGWKWAMSILRT
jgi:hypothetical protein